MDRAYPRSRGGTCNLCGISLWQMGLSPLARGNLGGVDYLQERAGPIPARAGEPKLDGSALSLSWAYPRSRGGTSEPCGQWCHPCGPIPARAGEPARRSPARSWCGAYPRSRGGTDPRSERPLAGQGLSPLARGNRPPKRAATCWAGPIPARAGEPRRMTTRNISPGAYPRSRGGTRRCPARQRLD